MATKWVSLDKLRYAISKIHTLLQGKVDKVDGKGLSANDLTAALKGNYDAAYTHSQAAHAPAAAEKNIIVGVQVNGSDLTPDGSRKVNVRVPTGARRRTERKGQFCQRGKSLTREQNRTGPDRAGRPG